MLFTKFRYFAIVVAFGAVVACEDASVSPRVLDAPSAGLGPLSMEVAWQNPLPLGNDLHRMWGFSGSHFIAVGDAGTIVEYDAGVWSSFQTPTRNDLHGIWAGAPNNIYVCGFAGTLLHFNGVGWAQNAIPTNSDLYAVWVSTDGSLFVTGSGGRVWRRQGSAWTEFALAIGERFQSVCGYSTSDVYAGGSNGHLHHFNGTAWNRIIVFDDPFYDTEILDMWAPGPGQIAFVDRFNILWFDGTNWDGGNVLDTNAYGIWGLSLQQQVAVSAGSSTHLINGVRTRFFTPSEEPLFDVWGLSTANYYAVGRYGTSAHFNGANWQALSAGSIQDIQDAWITPTEAIAATRDGTILRQNGTSWTEESVGTRYELNGVWQGLGTAVAVGRRGTADGLDWSQAILMNTGGSWVNAGAIGDAPVLFDVWGSHPNDIYAVGWAGEMLRYNGSSWSVLDDSNVETAYLRSISGTSPSNIITVGRTNDLHALIRWFDGLAWKQAKLNDVEELYGVWVESDASAFAVGTFGAIRRFDGAIWRKMKSPTRAPLFCVWGTSSTDVYAGGVDGTLVHYDGTMWRELLPQTNRSINSISGRSSNEVYFAGDKGSILRFDGL